MEKKFFYALPKKNRALGDMEHHWEHYIAPYRAAPHVWSVGANDDVCCYLIDTGDGLVLIDTSMEQTVYLLVDSIWRTGHDPKNIKKILLTHWHGDHVNGARLMKELTGAKLYLSREDEVMHQLHAADTKPFTTIPYTVDEFYDENTPICQGKMKFVTKLTPGHTPGATTIFFDDVDDETGEKFACAIHGGLGIGQMKPESLEKDGFSKEVAYNFIKTCTEMSEMKVDIFLSSHLNQSNVEPNIPADRNNYRVFIAPYAWHDILLNRAEAVKAFYPDRY